MAKQVSEKIAWHKYPIESCTKIEDNEWGYLTFYNDGSYEFIEERPSNEEILNHWDYVLQKNRKAANV